MELMYLIISGVVLFFGTFLVWASRYKRCPANKILVIYGKVGKDADGNRSAKCVHGGAAFVWPIFQDYQYLDLEPMTIDIDLRAALTSQNIRINVPSTFTIGISTESGEMENAAERLLGLGRSAVDDLARDIIFGQLRVVIATMELEEINADRDKFLSNIVQNVGTELKKVGLRLINANIKDVTDESGYIEALGREAAARAVNEAKMKVAEQERDGSIGEANARMEQRIKVAAANSEASVGEAKATKHQRIEVAAMNSDASVGEANADRDRRIKMSAADAEAIKGENEAKISVAKSDAERRDQEAQSERKASAAEKVQSAMALEEAYKAQQDAEKARATRDKASLYADTIVPSEIEKQKVEIEADAEAERIKRIARGEGDATFERMNGEARGQFEILSKQAQGLKEIVEAAGGNPDKAATLLVIDKLTEIVGKQVEAIQGIKIDKVVVWDSMNGEGGSPATANFLSGMLKSLPQFHDMFKMAGIEMPEYLGKIANGDIPAPAPTPAKPKPKMPLAPKA